MTSFSTAVDEIVFVTTLLTTSVTLLVVTFSVATVVNNVIWLKTVFVTRMMLVVVLI